MDGDTNWFDKFLDWTWGVFVAVCGGVAAMVHRIYRHDARLEALEESRAANAARLQSIEEKIDSRHDTLLAGINELRQEITAERREHGENHRMVVTELLARVPRP